jgi:hypothetical protein
LPKLRFPAALRLFTEFEPPAQLPGRPSRAKMERFCFAPSGIRVLLASIRARSGNPVTASRNFLSIEKH